MLGWHLHDATSPEEADTRYQTLNDVRHAVIGEAYFERNDYKKCGAQSDQHVRTHSRRLVIALALVSDQPAQEDGNTKTHGDAKNVGRVTEPDEALFKKRAHG